MSYIYILNELQRMKEEIVLDFIRNNPLTSSKDIHLGLQESFSYATIKRILKKLYDERLIVTEGKGRSTKYALSSPYDLFYPLDINEYFKNEQDQRKIKDAFDFGILDVLANVSIFTSEEDRYLNGLHEKCLENISKLLLQHIIKN